MATTNQYIQTTNLDRAMNLAINLQWAKVKDGIFRSLLLMAGLLVLLLSAGMVYSLVSDSSQAFRHFGFFGFLSSSDWIPTEGRESYGALAFIVGTLLTSLLALLICIPFSMPVALYTGEFYRASKRAHVISSLTELLAGIPSIVYGLWGFYTFRPLVISLGFNEQGFGIITSALVLSIMIIPYASSLSAEFISMTPNSLKEAAYSMGASRAEVTQSVVLPHSRSGILAAFTLALGRALGETMAVTMLIGNSNAMPTKLSDAGNSMASLIANQFGEADGLKLSSLIAIALLLFLITALINAVAKLMTRNLS